MEKDFRQRTMDDLIPVILAILARHKDEEFDSKTVAKELKTETEEINQCFENMQYLNLIELFTHFGPRYCAKITPLGLANLKSQNNSMEKKNE